MPDRTVKDRLTEMSRSIRRHPARSAVVFFVISTVLLITYIGISIAQVGNLASDLQKSSERLLESSESTDQDSMAGLVVELDALVARSEKVQDEIGIIRFTESLLGWVPVVGDSSKIAQNMLERTSLDLRVASNLVQTAISLNELLEATSGSQPDIFTALSSFPSPEQIDDASIRLHVATTLLDESDRLASEASSLSSPLGRLSNAEHALSNREGQIRNLLEWSIASTESLKLLSGLGTVFEPLVVFLSESGLKPENSLTALDTIPEAAKRSTKVAKSLNDLAETTPAIIKSSRFGRDLADLNIVVGSVADTSVALEYLIDAIDSAISTVRSAEGGLFGEGSGMLQAFNALSDHNIELEQAESLLVGARDRLSESKLARRSLESASEQLQSSIDSAINLTTMFRELGNSGEELLGANTAKNYLILGANADELRGSGGFVFGIWKVKIEDGQFGATEYFDTVQLDDWDSFTSYPQSPTLMQTHMDTPILLMRDVEWFSDFDHVAEQVEELWKLSGNNEQVDGVISLNQWALVELLGDIGELEVSGQKIAASDVMEIAELGTDSGGRQFADLIVQAVQTELTSVLSEESTLQLLSTLSSLLERKHVILHLSDRKTNDLIKRAGWMSTTNIESGDHLAVIDSNVGWNKVDRNITRSLSYDVDLTDTDALTSNVILSYKNDSISTDPQCDSQRRKTSATYDEYLSGCYWNLVRIYVPDGTKLISGDALPLPRKSISHILGTGNPGENTLEPGFDVGGNYFSGLLTVEPGETRSISLIMELPQSIIEQHGESLIYNLTLVAQPGALGRHTTARIRIPEDYELISSTPQPDNEQDRVLTYSLDVIRDESISIILTRS